jgi:NAD(P)-dependent dehydrogenase (short-subunit alcohol dehydrogenase family)
MMEDSREGGRHHRRGRRDRPGQRGRFAAEGAHVVAVDIDDDAGRERPPPRSAEFTCADVTDADGVQAMYAAGRRDLRLGIDIAFNNAGISPPDDDSILTTDADAWRRVQEVNLTSVYLCCKYGDPPCRRRGGARSSTPRRSWP